MARNTQKICVLQVDEHFLHAVLFAHTEAGLRAEAEFAQHGAWKREDASLANALKSFVEAHNLTECDIYTVMPRHEFASRFLVFPTHDEAELASMVRFSAAEYVPFPEHDLHIAQCFVSKEEGGESRALAVYAQKETIKKHLELLRHAGVTPAGIFLSTSCLAAAIEKAQVQEERFAVLNLGTGGIEVSVFEKGRLFFGRAVALPHEWNPQEGVSDTFKADMAAELRTSLSAYRRETEHGEPVETVYLCADAFDVSALCPFLGQETGKDCRPLLFSDAVVLGAETLENAGQLSALGAALLANGAESYRINLLPDNLKRARELKSYQRSALRIGAFAAVFILALAGLFAQAVYQRTAMIRTLEAQAKSIAPMAEGVASKQRQLAILRKQVEGSGNVLEAMWTVTNAVPEEEMTLTQFAYDGQIGIDVYGQAVSLDAIALFASQLRTMAGGQLDYFKNAKSLYENRGNLFDKEVYNFQITIPMKADDAG